MKGEKARGWDGLNIGAAVAILTFILVIVKNGVIYGESLELPATVHVVLVLVDVAFVSAVLYTAYKWFKWSPPESDQPTS